MASLEGWSTNKAPLFASTNYAFWKIRMRTYLTSLGVEVWIVVDEKFSPKDTDTKKEAKQNFISNEKSMNALLSGLCHSEFIKVMHSETAKDIWDTLENIHEGDKKVNMAKLQASRTQIEN